MAEAQIHQIEYRHHQTRDLSPVATSMPSQDSLRGWDSRIRAWVRHPHADRLSESVCYQVFSTGQAAMAWRYWDQRAVERADGSRGRPLVSRVLVGQANVLTPDVAVALCLAGLADLAGPMPGEVPDGGSLPTISGDALIAVTREKSPELDRDALKQPGLQALVAAALADPVTPLAISIRDVIIQKPLRESVQYPLMWGLRRITGRLLGQVGRGWSFSTFELPLGETDPSSLPAIVFRQAQDGAQAPPVRWRKEVKVRPLAPDALNPRHPYADCIDFAGRLVAEYEKRGGGGLDQLIAECCGTERSLQVRLDRIHEELRDSDSPLTVSAEAGTFVPLSHSRAARQDGPALTGSDPGEPRRDQPAVDEGAQVVTAERSQPQTREPVHPAADRSHHDPEAAGEASRVMASQPQQARIPEPDYLETGFADDNRTAAGRAPQVTSAEPDHAATPLAREDTSEPGPRQYGEGLPPSGFEPVSRDLIRDPSGDQVQYGDQEPGRGSHQSSARDERRKSLAPSKEGQTAPPLRPQSRSGQPGGPTVSYQEERIPQPAAYATVSELLKQLELAGNDADKFNSILEKIFEAGIRPDEHDDRRRSWEVIKEYNWYTNIRRYHELNLEALAYIFYIVVLPEFTERDAAGSIARWARGAPPPMVGALLDAAKRTNPGMWHDMMHILEPVLAARWVADHSIGEQWDADRTLRGATELGSGDNKGGFFGLRRRR